MPRVGPGPEGLIDASLPISELPGVSPPYGEVLLFRQKDPKPWTPRLALLEGRDANRRRAAQLAWLRQGPQRIRASLLGASRQASDGKTRKLQELL